MEQLIHSNESNESNERLLPLGGRTSKSLSRVLKSLSRF